MTKHEKKYTKKEMKWKPGYAKISAYDKDRGVGKMATNGMKGLS